MDYQTSYFPSFFYAQINSCHLIQLLSTLQRHFPRQLSFSTRTVFPPTAVSVFTVRPFLRCSELSVRPHQRTLSLFSDSAMDQINQKPRRKNWATYSFIHLFARTARFFARPTLLASLSRSTALTSPTPWLMGK